MVGRGTESGQDHNFCSRGVPNLGGIIILENYDLNHDLNHENLIQTPWKWSENAEMKKERKKDEKKRRKEAEKTKAREEKKPKSTWEQKKKNSPKTPASEEKHDSGRSQRRSIERAPLPPTKQNSSFVFPSYPASNV